jgi:aspartate carbamoyltransferase catalytic subunit
MTSTIPADRKPSPPAPGRLVWQRKHLLGLEGLSKQELLHVLDTATGFKSVSTRSIKKVPALRGKVVVNLFFEDSTRTRMSFALAAQRLSADVLEFSRSSSSVNKGETLIDTGRNIEAMGVDIMVIRHSAAGAPLMLANSVGCSVVNAGDGAHEHPTQGLLDLFTIREIKGRIEGLTVAIVGDITHSRVARSNIHALKTLGARVIVVGPNTLIPPQIEKLGVEVSHNFDEVLPQCDVVNMLRVQFERIQSSQFPSVAEYHRLFGLHTDRFARARKDVLVLHPGPINRGLELDSAIADGPNSAILRQVSNGLAVRMAVLYLVHQAALAEAEKKDAGTR